MGGRFLVLWLLMLPVLLPFPAASSLGSGSSPSPPRFKGFFWRFNVGSNQAQGKACHGSLSRSQVRAEEQESNLNSRPTGVDDCELLLPIASRPRQISLIFLCCCITCLFLALGTMCSAIKRGNCRNLLYFAIFLPR